MSKNSSRNKSAILGLPHGTAVSKLRKNVLFYVLKKHSENKCFKCGEEIETADTLSIEHKKPWQSSGSADLFWDMENIAFSHMKCNRPDKPYLGGPPSIARPEGMNWCSPGQHFAPVEEFYKHSGEQEGLQHWCKSHRYKR
jgi:hypothetical protein